MAQVPSQGRNSLRHRLVPLLSALVLSNLSLAGAVNKENTTKINQQQSQTKSQNSMRNSKPSPLSNSSSKKTKANEKEPQAATATQPQPKVIQPAPLIANSNDTFLTCLSCDKQIYRQGENFFLRGVLLRASDHQPMNNPPQLAQSGIVIIKGPLGEMITRVASKISGSILTYGWSVPTNAPGGEYTATVVYPSGYPSATRKFDVRAYRAPRLNSQIVFARDGYGPGEKVTATLEVQRAEGGFPKDARVTVSGIVDGKTITGESSFVDAAGKCTVSLNLPQKIERGDGTLSLTIADGGVVESACKTIPILVKFVDLQIYPEGGDLVANLKNRVYLQALQTNGKPADLEGSILSEGSETAVASFRTEHEGRGRFEFVPESDKKYFLKITKPAGFEKLYELPAVKPKGAVIRADKDTYKANEAVVVKVGSTEGAVRVTLSKKERELIATDLFLPTAPDSGKSTIPSQAVVLPAGRSADGVLTVTVYDSNNKPLAERLVFKEPSNNIKIDIKPDKEKYAPGDKAKITFKATDSKGKPVAASLGISITDESTIQLVEKRAQAPALPVMFFLEPEVQDLADAHIYFDAANPKASLATDLLLGTQGWRRFALQDLRSFLNKFGDKARTSLCLEEVRLQHSAKLAGRLGELPTDTSQSTGYGLDFRDLVVTPDNPTAASKSQGYSSVAPLAFVRKHAPYGQNNENGRVEGPRDLNMFQVEPSVIDERYYTTGRTERRQKSSPIIPEPGSSWIYRYTNFDSNNAPIYIREFAHRGSQTLQKSERNQFTDTIYWNAALNTDAETGEATAEFELNDSVTAFRVAADGFTAQGALGANHKEIESVRPIYAEMKLPLEVTIGDTVLMPINLVNGSGKPIKSLKVEPTLPKGFKLLEPLNVPSGLKTDERLRTFVPILVQANDGENKVSLEVVADDYKDIVTRTIKVKHTGFPKQEAKGGLIEPSKIAKASFSIDKDMVPNSIETSTQVYPGPVGKLTSALEALIRQPHGCFEQVSSTSYPLTMAQQYFLSHSSNSFDQIEKSKGLLADAYKKLLAYRCTNGGYDWYGNDPGNVALTAYGIMQFTDMSQVQPVDARMIADTRAWILKQRDGRGGFTSVVHGMWSADKEATDAYIVWALLESGQPEEDLKQELASLAEHTESTQNSYVTALAANAFANSQKKDLAAKLRTKLAKLQMQDGSVSGATATVLGNCDSNMHVQATALATLAWLKDPTYADNAARGISYLAEISKNGAFGSTQSTVLALKAIIAYDNLNTVERQSGKVRLICDGKPIGDWHSFDKENVDLVKLPNLNEVLNPGEHTIELALDGGIKMPYSIGINYSTALPESSKDCQVSMATKLASDHLTEGQAGEVLVVIENLTKNTLPMPIAIIELPGGIEPRHAQLKELVKKGSIAHYDVDGQRIVLYWRAMAPAEKKQIPLSVVAAVPGTYTGTASQAYLYYADESKKWVPGLKVMIQKSPH